MKKTIIIGLSLYASLFLNAQEAGQYFHLNVGGGVHNLSYDLQNGEKNNGQLGYTLNAAYSWFFSPYWGLQTGLGIQKFNGLSTINYLQKSSAVDASGRPYEFRVNYNNWQEKQEALFLDVPLVLQYRHNIGEKYGIIGSSGLKVSIPVSTSYKSMKTGTLTSTGYYSQWNTEFSDLPQYGFTTLSDVTKGDISLKTSYMAVADLGGLIKLSDKSDLYIGAYVNYGLNNILNPGTKEIFQSGGVYNGVFASTQTSKVVPFSIGVKIGLYLRLGDKDSDKDGVPDRKDKCSNTPKEAIGFIDLNGCPIDTDVDGVPDYLDKCSNTPKEAIGLVDENGCPKDTDGDGVPDYLDKCPNTPKEAIGCVDQNGCPKDTDRDGIPDCLDKCPNTPKEAVGFVDEKGCPKDSDGDGIPDYLDRCPNTPKEAYSNIDQYGCPKDSDGDGVPDFLDKCPNTPKAAFGFVNEKGCPIDTDGDGVPDYLDKCPTLFGVVANSGCPEVKQEVKALFKKALKGIQFETGNAKIKPVSFNLLNQIAVMLISNTTYIIDIQGHTDNQGKPEVNQVLSEKRAGAVKDYLINAGVDSKRLISTGYGASKPIAPNTTPEGRVLNRRVEFEVTFEDVVK